MMNDVRKIVIDALARIVAEKRIRVMNIGMTNSNTDEVTRMRLSIDYAQAQSDLSNAEEALRAEMSREGE
jgi:hypothetical protein